MGNGGGRFHPSFPPPEHSSEEVASVYFRLLETWLQMLQTQVNWNLEILFFVLAVIFQETRLKS